MSEPGLRAIIWCAVSTKSQTDDDKISLPQQEADARAACEREEWQIIDVLRVPGHSRDYIDIHECAADMQRQGINAFNRLLTHWANRAFDVLIVRDGDRFARTQAMHAYVTERTIQIGARIYVMNGGLWVDASNAGMWTAFDGYKARHEMTRIRDLFQTAMDKRLHEGKPLGPRAVFSHRIVRDTRGKALGLEVIEEYRYIWDAAAIIFLAGTSYRKMGAEMQKRGILHPDTGKRFSTAFFHSLWHRPAFWGNSARHYDSYRRRELKHANKLWCFDPDTPAPPGVDVVYGTHDAVYTGDLARRIQAEMRLRAELRGNASSVTISRFSGLLVCVECGHNLSWQKRDQDGNGYYRCHTHWSPNHTGDCDTRTIIYQEEVQDWVDERLHAMIDGLGVGAFDPQAVNTGETPIAEQIATLEATLADNEKALERLVLRRAQEDDDTIARALDTAIANLSQQIKDMQTHLAEVRSRQPSRATNDEQQRASVEIAELSISALWQLENREINQLLRRLLGDVRIVCDHHQIVGLIDRRALG